MKIAFIESFINEEWNGYTARYESGVSGSHCAIFYLAEALANKNHDITVIQTQCNFNPKIVNGVYYQSMENIPEKDATYYDVIVFTSYLKDLIILNKISNYNKLAFVMGCPELSKYDKYNHNNIFDIFDSNKLNILYVSENSKLNSFIINYRIESIRHHLLYNSIDIKDFTNANGELFTYPEDKKENNFVFFACVERGFNIVLEVAKKFDGKFNIVASNYNFSTFHSEKFTFGFDRASTKTVNFPTNSLDCSPENSFSSERSVDEKMNHNNDTSTVWDNVKIIHPKTTSKQEILDWNHKSKYFIYPVINTSNFRVHYDTFAYVVLEALLCGTIVIAPRMRVFEELYGDAIYYIDTSDIVDDKDLIWSHWFDPATCMIWDKVIENMGYPLVERYVKAVQHLESDVELRKTYINRGFSLKEKFLNTKMADRFIDFFANQM
jgi:glycosyltransferase involved in cell wall biosynthesis